MGQSSKAPWTKFDRHFSEKGIGAWGGCLLRCLLNTPWNSRLMILFDKSAKKRLSQWQHPCCVRRWEGDRNLFQAGIFYFARLALRWTLSYSMATKYSSTDTFPGDTLYSKTKPPCATTSNSNHLPWELNHLYKTPKIPLPNKHLLYSWKLSQTTPFCKWQWPHFRAD